MKVKRYFVVTQKFYRKHLDLDEKEAKQTTHDNIFYEKGNLAVPLVAYLLVMFDIFKLLQKSYESVYIYLVECI